MRRLDRLACVSLVGLALGGHLVVERVTLALDPALAVATAWERAGGGPIQRFPGKIMPHGIDRRPIADPWGYPMRWDPEPTALLGLMAFG